MQITLSVSPSIPRVHAEGRFIDALWPGPVHNAPGLEADETVLPTLELAASDQADG